MLALLDCNNELVTQTISIYNGVLEFNGCANSDENGSFDIMLEYWNEKDKDTYHISGLDFKISEDRKGIMVENDNIYYDIDCRKNLTKQLLDCACYYIFGLKLDVILSHKGTYALWNN